MIGTRNWPNLKAHEFPPLDTFVCAWDGQHYHQATYFWQPPNGRIEEGEWRDSTGGPITGIVTLALLEDQPEGPPSAP